VDDVSGKAKSVVVIWEENGKLFGRIEILVGQESHDTDPRCARCDGDLKGRPLIGLRILWDLQRSSDPWAGGKILDPDNGKIYKCSISLDGKKLKCVGSLASPWLVKRSAE
jgi:uncharacterized protein (DUF2147 family)